MNTWCNTCMRPLIWCTRKRCTHTAPASCDLCDGTAADAIALVLDVYGPVGEACAGIDWDDQPCPRRAETGSVWCDLHVAPGAVRLPIPIPIVRIEVAA